ncbi:hypothetical protein [Xanthomonas euvesicatoria]|uniref:hypothetical protein n=1 Tax=Xanthomonas euvesicatoria TaxID=456327 RepID=UPI0014954E68|nr:hypothetical protein [Xanthomonas euvesicatoria]
MTRWVTGVGSRETPAWAFSMLRHVLQAHAAEGYGIRTGCARLGGDVAAREAAATSGCPVQVYTVDKGHFPGSIRFDHQSAAVQSAALQLAERLHPAWRWQRSTYVRQLHARNGFQCLSTDLASPSDKLICWAPKSVLDEDGRLQSVGGGTGQAVRVAHEFGVPAFNLDLPAHRQELASYLVGFEMPVEVHQDQEEEAPQLGLFR